MGERETLERLVETLDDPAALHPALRALSTETPWWRLSAAVLLQAAGLIEPARAMCRGFIMTMGPTSEALRQLAEQVAQVTIKLGEFDALQHYIRACYKTDVGVGLGNGPQHSVSGAVIWTLCDGRCDFTFSDMLPAHAYLNTVAKHWALELPLLLRYAAAHPEFRGSVRLGLEDIGHRPGLAFCESRRDYFLLPDPFFIGTDAYRTVRERIDAGALAWADRRPVGFWRGTTTGWLNCTGKECQHWRELPRAVLCELAQNGPDAALYDVGLSNVVQLQPAAAAEVTASGLLRDHVPPLRQAHYKYQIDIDGNSNSWMGLFIKLYSGSPVLKVQSAVGFRQWYYDRLKPWWNFVPVRRDMADLTSKLRWLRDNDAAAAAMGQRGRDLAIDMTLEREIIGAFPTMTAAFRHAEYMNRGG